MSARTLRDLAARLDRSFPEYDADVADLIRRLEAAARAMDEGRAVPAEDVAALRQAAERIERRG